MTRMERRRRRRRILRIKLATTAAVLALTTASIVALTGGAAETASEPTPQPPALQAEPVLLVAEHDSTYQPVQMTAEPVQEPEPVEEEDENEKIEAALLEQGYLHEEIPLDFDLQCHLIAVCEEYGVPQNVALGVIQAESSFTATAANGSCYGYSGELLTRGNAAECRKAIGCASLDSFYALANRARRGINKKYRVVIKKGGQVDYPVLGKDDPFYKKEG